MASSRGGQTERINSSVIRWKQQACGLTAGPERSIRGGQKPAHVCGASIGPEHRMLEEMMAERIRRLCSGCEPQWRQAASFVSPACRGPAEHVAADADEAKKEEQRLGSKAVDVCRVQNHVNCNDS